MTEEKPPHPLEYAPPRIERKGPGVIRLVFACLFLCPGILFVLLAGLAVARYLDSGLRDFGVAAFYVGIIGTLFCFIGVALMPKRSERS
jgi:hypothetical protein